MTSMPAQVPPRTVEVVDVGHGSCTLVIDGGEVVIIDAGLGSSVLEILEEKGIRSVRQVLISHADADHIGGLVAILSARRVSIGEVRLNSDAEKNSKIWDDLLYELSKLDQQGELRFQISIAAGSGGRMSCGSIELEVVAPSKYIAGKGPGGELRSGRRLTTNSVSAVIRVLDGSQPVALLAADIDDVGLDEMLNSGQDIAAPVLVFPHHGGYVGDGEVATFVSRLCAAVKPEVVVFSIGRGRYDTPRPEVVRALRSEVPRVWIACTQLSKNCAKELPKSKPIHLSGSFANGRPANACCAGTFVINLSARQRMPDRPEHERFVAAEAPTALCR